MPLLGGFGVPLLYGPGSILDAHTDTEHVQVSALHRAAADYVALADHLLR